MNKLKGTIVYGFTISEKYKGHGTQMITKDLGIETFAIEVVDGYGIDWVYGIECKLNMGKIILDDQSKTKVDECHNIVSDSHSRSCGTSDIFHSELGFYLAMSGNFKSRHIKFLHDEE